MDVIEAEREGIPFDVTNEVMVNCIHPGCKSVATFKKGRYGVEAIVQGLTAVGWTALPEPFTAAQAEHGDTPPEVRLPAFRCPSTHEPGAKSHRVLSAAVGEEAAPKMIAGVYMAVVPGAGRTAIMSDCDSPGHAVLAVIALLDCLVQFDMASTTQSYPHLPRALERLRQAIKAPVLDRVKVHVEAIHSENCGCPKG